MLIDEFACVSPALAEGGTAAREVKFLVDSETALELERRLRDRLAVDAHGCPTDGYRVTTVHLDTPGFDAYFRTGEIDAKHRLRRYGDESVVHFERKVKSDGCVSKRRTAVALARVADELADCRPAAPAGWFACLVGELALRPVALTHYRRLAFVGMGEHGPIRATVDRLLRGAPQSTLSFDPPTTAGPPFVAGAVIELKYHGDMPEVFLEATTELNLMRTTFSKYRRFVAWAGLAPQEPSSAA